MKTFAVAMACLFVLCGCAETTTSKQAVNLQPIALRAIETSKPIAFRKIVLRFSRNETIGQIGIGLACIKQADLKPEGGRVEMDAEEITEVFRNQLESNGYKVVGNPDALFEDASLAQAEFLIGALVTDVEAKFCYPLGGFGDFSIVNAAVYMKVNWQIFGTLDRKVVYETYTEGSSKVVEAEDPDLAFDNAFSLAAQNLLADTKFHALVAGTGTSETVVAKPEGLKIDGIRIDQGKKFDAAGSRASVVTVRSPTGHGSGFFVSSNGFILTNEHVVSGTRNVRIILHNGREISGEVLRTSSRRDVAVIKVANEGFVPTSIAGNEPQIGVDVYAIGAPLDESLSGTVSKGIVSSYRVQQGQRLIQSDVNIQPGSSGGPLLDAQGNVVAITVSGRVTGEALAGVNFFIPIRSAFEALGIDPGSPM